MKAEVVSISGLSAHADAAQLVQWLKTTPQPPRRVFITYGEPAAADALRRRIEHELGWAGLGWPATVPLMGRTVALDA